MKCHAAHPGCTRQAAHCAPGLGFSVLHANVHSASQNWGAASPHLGHFDARPKPQLCPQPRLFVTRAALSRSTTITTASSSGTIVKLSMNCNTALGEVVKLVGSCPELGNWSPDQAPQLESTARNTWTLDLRLSPGRYEFKALIVNTVTRQGRWEDGDNYELEVPSQPGVLQVSCTWGTSQLSARLLSAQERPRAGTPRPSARSSPTPYRSLSPSVARASTPSAYRPSTAYRPTTPGPTRRVAGTPSTLMRTPITDGCTRLLVGNLPRTMKVEEVSRMFTPFGRVDDVALIRDRYTGKPKGMATVVMESSAAKEACRALHNRELAPGKPLVVEPVREGAAMPGRPAELKTVNGSRAGTPRPARTPLPGR